MHTVAEPTRVDWIPGLDDKQFAGVAPGEAQEMSDARKQAFETYAATPAPTRYDEEWRRTDPSLFTFNEWARLPDFQPKENLNAHDWDEQFSVVVAVEDGAYQIIDREGLLAEGALIVKPLAQAVADHPDLVREHLSGKALPAASSKFAAMNAAFWNVGFFVHIPEGVELDKGVFFRYRQTKSNGLIMPRLLIVGGNKARGQVTELYQSDDGLPMGAVTGKEIYVGEAGRIRLATFQEWGDETGYIANDGAWVARDAQVDWVSFNFGGKLCKMNVAGDVAGPGASAELDGLFLTTRDQHYDQRTLQIHSSPDTYSNLLYKGVAREKSHSVYQGVIIARRGAIRVDAYQTNNNIVLDDTARADSIPGLLIDADDLACSHGATIGNLDEEQLFYLRSRGLPYKRARRLVIQGFYSEVVQRVPQDFLQEYLNGRIAEQLDA